MSGGSAFYTVTYQSRDNLLHVRDVEGTVDIAWRGYYIVASIADGVNGHGMFCHLDRQRLLTVMLRPAGIQQLRRGCESTVARLRFVTNTCDVVCAFVSGISMLL